MAESTPEITIVSPVYRGEKMLHSLVGRCKEALSTFTQEYEIILVNDHSPDDSWRLIEDICAKDKKIKGVDLSRNFGQLPAVSAGLRLARGRWVVVMDCDLQDPPEEIPRLYAKALEGWDVVQARRVNRQDSYMKRLSGRVYHAVYDYFVGYKSDSAIGNFGIYRSSVIDEFCKVPDMCRGFNALITYLGFRSTTLDVKHAEREEGKSSYTLHKLLKLAFDNCISNSNKPLWLAVKIGFVMSTVSFALAVYNVIAKLCNMISVSGFTTTVFSIWFVGGLILLILGVLGIYIGRIYDQVKGRPYVVIREIIN